MVGAFLFSPAPQAKCRDHISDGGFGTLLRYAKPFLSPQLSTFAEATAIRQMMGAS
jgi:hypothetical protein